MSTFVLRGALLWGMEIAGRRAAWSVLSELRLALVERRLRAQPTAADGAESAEIAAVAVQGIEGLESYFARYLPQASWRRSSRCWWSDGSRSSTWRPR